MSFTYYIFVVIQSWVLARAEEGEEEEEEAQRRQREEVKEA